jgi:NADH-quinone oxidoreductase subunit M
LPGLSGFVGEFLSIFGTFMSIDNTPATWTGYLPIVFGTLAATGVILGAVYLLVMFHRMFFGKLDHAKNGKLRDLSGRELAVFIPLVIGIFVMGIVPRPMLRTMEPSVRDFLRTYNAHVKEPDCGAHVYGTCPDPVPDGTVGQGDVQADLDRIAKAAADAAGTVDRAAAPGGQP